MTSKELNIFLVARFPNLFEKYMDEISWQEGDDTGSHTVYGDILAPYLASCIRSGSREEIQAVFDFLEELLGLEDSYVNEVVCFSVLESNAYLFG